MLNGPSNGEEKVRLCRDRSDCRFAVIILELIAEISECAINQAQCIFTPTVCSSHMLSGCLVVGSLP